MTPRKRLNSYLRIAPPSLRPTSDLIYLLLSEYAKGLVDDSVIAHTVESWRAEANRFKIPKSKRWVKVDLVRQSVVTPMPFNLYRSSNTIAKRSL